MRNALLIALTSLCFVLAAHSATLTAASSSQSDVQAAINTAAPGDTVKIPAANTTWGAAVEIAKPVIILGAGQGQTTIHGNGISLFHLKCPTDGRIEIANLSLTSDSNQQGFGISMDNSGTLLNSIVIHHIDFAKFLSAFQNGTNGNSAGFGVCYQCNFNNCKIPTRNKGFLKSMSATAIGTVPSPAWGTAKYMIVEDCVYTLDQNATEFYLTDTDGPMNAMFRFNKINITHSSGWTESGWDMHGDNAKGGVNAFNNGYGTVAHDNVFTVSGGAQVDKLADIRGGVGSLIYKNSVTGSSSPNSVRNVIRANAFTGDQSSITPTKTYFDANTTNGDPVQLQNDGTGGKLGVNYWNNSGLPAGYTEVAYPSPLRAGSPSPTPTPPPAAVADGTTIPVGIGANQFSTKVAATWQLIGTVKAPDGGSDSFWIDINSDPSGDDTRCWDLTASNTFGPQTAKWRSADPKTWILQPGTHTLYIGQREPAQITEVKFVAGGPPIPTPTPTPAPTPTPDSTPLPSGTYTLPPGSTVHVP